jgi:hypothetical protein
MDPADTHIRIRADRQCPARDKRSARREIDSYWEDVEEDRRLRECWNFHYSLYPARFADHILDMYEIPKPPSRARRMPE